MPTIAGLRGTGNWGPDERPKNFREMILWLDPNGEAPLTALMSKMGSESVDDPEFSWWEETQPNIQLKVNGLQAIGTTAFEVDPATGDLSDARAVVAGDLLLVQDSTGRGEILRVTSDPTTATDLVVSRATAGSTAAAVADNTLLLKIGNAFAEGTGSPTSTNRNPDKLSNLCQIFKSPYELTNTARKTKLRTGDPLKNDKKRKMFDHARDMEQAFLWGRRYETVGPNGKPMRFTGGLNSFIQTNRLVFNQGGNPAFNLDDFLEFVGTLFNRRGSGAGNERIAFLGNVALTAINKAILNADNTRINYDKEITKTYGMDLHALTVPQGTLYLKTHPLMNIDPIFTESMFIFNPKGLIYRPFRDTEEQDNIQANDADELKGQWLTECGLEVHFERTMGYAGEIR